MSLLPPSMSAGNGHSIEEQHSLSTPMAEGEASIDHIQGLPVQYPLVFQRSPDVVASHDAFLACLRAWRQSLDTTQPVTGNGGSSESKGEELDTSPADGFAATDARERTFSDHAELERLKDSYELHFARLPSRSNCAKARGRNDNGSTGWDVLPKIQPTLSAV